MNQSEFLAITSYLLKAREKPCVQGAIGFGFASHWLKNWREIFEPITKRSNHDRVITFDSHLKTSLSEVNDLKFFPLLKTFEFDLTDILKILLKSRNAFNGCMLHFDKPQEV